MPTRTTRATMLPMPPILWPRQHQRTQQRLAASAPSTRTDVFFVLCGLGRWVSLHFSLRWSLKGGIWRGDAFWLSLFRGCAMGDGLCDTLTIPHAKRLGASSVPTISPRVLLSRTARGPAKTRFHGSMALSSSSPLTRRLTSARASLLRTPAAATERYALPAAFPERKAVTLTFCTFSPLRTKAS